MNVTMPLRYGGMGLLNPVVMADKEFIYSTMITKPLSVAIQQQSEDLEDIDFESMKTATKDVQKMKNEFFASERDEVVAQLDEEKKKYVELAAGRGSSSWLSVLPLKRAGYILNRQEFRDGISLRYGFPIRDAPMHCACGEENTTNHTLNCKKGGYVSMRHNAL